MLNTTERVRRSTAERAFREARRHARRERFWSHLRGQPARLFSYDEVARTLRARETCPVGVCDIPLDAIVGSVGRYADFTRSFYPRRDDDRTRWMRLHLIMTDSVAAGLPPIKVYRVGDAYFVIDGNHRVSVARMLNAKRIRARVTEVSTRVPLCADDDREVLAIKGEYADFLVQTRLDETYVDVNLLMTMPGKYDVLLNHIANLGDRLGIAVPRAASQWYDSEYLPAVHRMRDHPLLQVSAALQRSETDVYVWLLERTQSIRARCGWSISAVSLAESLCARHEWTPAGVFTTG